MTDRGLSIVVVCLITASISFSAQSKTAGAGDGWEVTEPKSLDTVRFKHYTKESVKEVTLQEVEHLWPDVAREEILRQMGVIRHPKTVDFLYRAAIIDPTLYKGRAPEGYTHGQMAIASLVRTGHRSVPEKLEVILRAPMKLIPEFEARDIKGRAARELLRFKGVARELVFKTLDDNAQAGQIFCLYPPPRALRRPDGSSISVAVEPEAAALMRKWLGHKNSLARLEAAWCLAPSDVQDQRVREFAEAALRGGRPKEEQFFGEKILESLAVRGDKRAEKARDLLEMKKEIKRLSLGNPARDKEVREDHEKEFREKWGHDPN